MELIKSIFTTTIVGISSSGASKDDMVRVLKKFVGALSLRLK